MNAWMDEGRVYLLDREPAPKLRLVFEEETPPERAELHAKMVKIDATSLLLEQSRFEAASALYSCGLDLSVGDALPFSDAPVWVNLRAPAELVFTLENMERDTAWFVREAIAKVLPHGYYVSEYVVQADI